MILPDRTGQVWERIARDPLDAVWVVLGPPKGDGHPSACLAGDMEGTVDVRVENCGEDSEQTSWEQCKWLRRLV